MLRHAVLRRLGFFSCMFGCGASNGVFGTLRRMSGIRPSSAAVLEAFKVVELAIFFKVFCSASLRRAGVNGKPHSSLILFFNSPRRSHIFLAAPIFPPLYKISPALFTLSAAYYDAATYSQQQQQQQHISRTSYVCIAPRPVTYVVHIALNM